jgi:two-component system, NarL family, response regulator NreC
MDIIRILICDDHAFLRAGIISALEHEPGLFVVGEAENGKDLIEKYELLKPDLIITDISMPGLSGTTAVKELKLKYPQLKALFLSVLQGEIYVYYIIKVGGLGLLDKTIIKGELLLAINEVYNGRYYFGPNYNEQQIKDIIKKYDREPVEFKLNPCIEITEIQDKILEYICDGLSSFDIAEKLNMSKRTVDSHRGEIMHKFELKKTLDLIRFAFLYKEFKKTSVNPDSLLQST